MKILAAYKPSAEAEAVLDAAVEQARFQNAELLLVRLVKRQSGSVAVPIPHPQAPSEARPPAGRTAVRDTSGQDVDKLRADLESVRRRVADRGVACEAVLIEDADDDAEPILELADQEKVGMIVVGVRRRTRVGKAVIKSDAQSIILNANCPVLAVKSDD